MFDLLLMFAPIDIIWIVGIFVGRRLRRNGGVVPLEEKKVYKPPEE